MTFNAARKKLKKLAKGKFCQTEYQVVDFSGGDVEQECRLYIADIGYNTGKTWKEAFDKLHQTLNPSPVKIEDGDIEEIN